MDRNQDWYQVLGVEPDCPSETIRARYLLLIRQLSAGPWTGGERPSVSTLNEAFRNIGDPVARAGYDRARAREREEAAAVSEPAPVEPVSTRVCPFCDVSLRPEQATGPEDECTQCCAPLFPAQKHAQLHDSRRLFDRLPFTMRLHFVRSRTPERPARGISIDFSLGGLRLMTPIQLEVGEKVMVECEFCTAVAIVKRVHRADGAEGEPWEAGLQFVTLSLKRQRGGLLSASA